MTEFLVISQHQATASDLSLYDISAQARSQKFAMEGAALGVLQNEL